MNVASVSALSGVGAAPSAPSPAPVSPSGDATPATSFEQALGQVFTGAIDSLRQGEAAAIQGMQGALPAYKVVEAVMGAQRTLQAALAIRDKAVSAYQEISRMNI